MPSLRESLLVVSIVWAWPCAMAKKDRPAFIAAPATLAKSCAPWIATSDRIPERSPATSPESLRKAEPASCTPALSPEVDAVNTADTFPIVAAIYCPICFANAGIFDSSAFSSSNVCGFSR